MSIDEKTLVGDLPESVVNDLQNELVNASKDNPFVPYLIANQLKIEEAYECFPFDFPEDMTKETKAAAAEVIANFFKNEVMNAESVPNLPLALSVLISRLTKEHAQIVFIMAVRTVRLRFPDWKFDTKPDESEGNSK